MDWLRLLAVLVNLADAAQTCELLNKGGRELNPLLPQSCKGVIAVKMAAITPLFVLPDSRFRRTWTIGVLVGGSVGTGVTLLLRLKEE